MLCPSCGHNNSASAKFCEECATRLDAPNNEAPRSDLLTSADFVGRRQEMGELVTALDDALGGRGRLVMLVGEPGIGKTRIAQELAAISEERGAQVLWGRCYEGEGAPPYWPWVQIIRAYIQDKEPQHIDSVMDAGAADVAEIVPQLRQKLPDLQPPPSLEPEAARFRLFDSITTFLKKASSASGGRPLVLILDNLHWADRTSLLLLEFLAPELERSHILVLGTYRDVDVSRSHPLSQTLGNLIREHLFQRVQLRGMTLEEVRRFIEITAETSVSPEIVDAVHSRTEGNPLFVTEVVRLLKQEGFEEGQSWVVSIPEGIRDAIGRRLSMLSEECNQVLTTASVVGREFSIQQLDRLVDGPPTGTGQGLSEDEILGILEEAAEAYVIEEVEGGIGFYRFTHALIQQTLASELSTTRRVRTHALIAEALEDIYADDLEAHAEELAHHYYEAAAMIGPGKMVHYSLMAGEQALATYAYEDALDHFQRALAAKEGQATDAETAALLFGLGRAQVATLEFSQMAQAVASLSRAFEYFQGAGDLERALAAAEEYPVFPVASVPEVTALIEKAIELVPPDSHAAGRLLTRYAVNLSLAEGQYEAAREPIERALVIARREGDIALQIRALVDGSRVDGWLMRWEDSLAKSLEALNLMREADYPGYEIPARFWASANLIGAGELAHAREVARGSLAVAERLGHRAFARIAFWTNEAVARFEGNWDEARDMIERGLLLDPQEARFLFARVVNKYDVGDLEQGQEYLDRLVAVARAGVLNISGGTFLGSVVLTVAAIARITGDTAQLEEASDLFEDLHDAAQLFSIEAIQARSGLGMVAVAREDAGMAREQYALLMPIGLTGFEPWSRGWMTVSRVLGLLTHTMGELDKAEEHFEDALAYCRKGFRPELAWTCCDYADMLLERNNEGDRQKAIQLLDESLAISTELGMRPLMERVQSFQEQVESRHAKVPAFPDGLTQREVEVLRLLHLGKSNREVAAELFISLSTVAHHVSSIFNKTGVSNRTEAATYAARNGLVPE